MMHLYRFAGGKVAEVWANRDDVGVMRQLGLLPARSPAASHS
jgi:predicted ester cyclase